MMQAFSSPQTPGSTGQALPTCSFVHLVLQQPLPSENLHTSIALSVHDHEIHSNRKLKLIIINQIIKETNGEVISYNIQLMISK